MTEPDELSVLDYFAAAALTGLVDAANTAGIQLKAPQHKSLAVACYMAADAMMAERAKRTEPTQ